MWRKVGRKCRCSAFPCTLFYLPLETPLLIFSALMWRCVLNKIDLFSVKLHDFKGPELEVLETVPWAKVAQLLLFVINDHIPNQGGHSGYQCWNRISSRGKKVKERERDREGAGQGLKGKKPKLWIRNLVNVGFFKWFTLNIQWLKMNPKKRVNCDNLLSTLGIKHISLDQKWFILDQQYKIFVLGSEYVYICWNFKNCLHC